MFDFRMLCSIILCSFCIPTSMAETRTKYTQLTKLRVKTIIKGPTFPIQINRYGIDLDRF